LMFFVIPQLSFHIPHIIDPGKDDRLEGWQLVAGKITGPKLREEIHEYLIIGRRIYFINNENDWFFCPGTPHRQGTEQRLQRIQSGSSVRKCTESAFNLSRNMVDGIQQFLRKGGYKLLLILERKGTHPLKIKAHNLILSLQNMCQCPKYCRLSVLACLIDREICPFFHHLSDGSQSGREVNHVVKIRSADTVHVKFFCHKNA